MKSSTFTDGLKPFPSTSPASNAACLCESSRQQVLTLSKPWTHEISAAAASLCALNTGQHARPKQITSWRKHYSIAYLMQITQMFIATSTTTGGEGWGVERAGRTGRLSLHGTMVSDGYDSCSRGFDSPEWALCKIMEVLFGECRAWREHIYTDTVHRPLYTIVSHCSTALLFPHNEGSKQFWTFFFDKT